MNTLEREREDALLEARPVHEGDVADTAVDNEDDSLGAFTGMLIGIVAALPLWAAVAIAIMLFVR